VCIFAEKKDMKADLQLITACILSIGGMALLFCGTFIAPEGEIDESLLCKRTCVFCSGKIIIYPKTPRRVAERFWKGE